MICKKQKIIRLFWCFISFFIFICNPLIGVGQKVSQNRCNYDTLSIYNDLINIVSTNGYRNYKNSTALNQTAGYIFAELNKVCDTVYEQQFPVDTTIYKNVVGVLGAKNKSILVIGAHYDVCGNQPGADDNASGVAALLALARKLKNLSLQFQIQFIAYTLEEPPFFRTQNMGSYIHAYSLLQQQADVIGMICFDMIGFYSDERKSQQYPVKIMKWFYGTRGNYITVIQQYGNGAFGRKMKRYIKQTNLIKTKSLKSPASVKGVDFSDHLNYIKMGYPAVFITNTAFYRNKNYHQTTDIIATLNMGKMYLVIEEVYLAIIKLNKKYLRK